MKLFFGNHANIAHLPIRFFQVDLLISRYDVCDDLFDLQTLFAIFVAEVSHFPQCLQKEEAFIQNEIKNLSANL